MSAYIVSTDTIDLIVSALREIQGPAKSSDLGLQEIGQILLDENVRSVNFRYNETTPREPYTFNPVDLNMVKEWRVVALKSARCWQYQACETDDFKSTTAYSIAEAFMGLLGVTDKHPAYDAAPWGWVRTIEEPTPDPEPEPEPPSKSTAEHASDIRRALKTRHGWTSRQVSVTSRCYSMGSSIDVRIKDPNVPLSAVKAIANKAERIDRCPYSGDILSGGNRYVHVSYDYDTLEAMGQAWLPAVTAAEATRRPQDDNALLPVAGTPYLIGKGSNGWGCSVWGEDGHISQCNDLRGCAEVIAVRMAGQAAVR